MHDVMAPSWTRPALGPGEGRHPRCPIDVFAVRPPALVRASGPGCRRARENLRLRAVQLRRRPQKEQTQPG